MPRAPFRPKPAHIDEIARGIKEFAERFSGDYRHNGFRDMGDPKATPLPPPTVQRDEGYAYIEQAFPPDPLFGDGFRCLMFPFAPGADLRTMDMATTGEARVQMIPSVRATHGRLAVAVTTSSDRGAPVAELRRVRTTMACTTRSRPRWAETGPRAIPSATPIGRKCCAIPATAFVRPSAQARFSTWTKTSGRSGKTGSTTAQAKTASRRAGSKASRSYATS